jgi:hypothetical protein
MGVGDYFRNLSQLFKSAKQREHEKERQRRQAFRRAEIALDDVKAKIKNLEREGKDAWSQARELIKTGQKAAAQRGLVKYRGTQVMAVKLDQKRFAFEQSLMQLEMAKTDNSFAKALDLMAAVTDINPEKVDDVLVSVDMKRTEQGEVDKLWQKEYQRFMEGAEGALEDFVPSLEELSAQLEDEAAQEIGTNESETAKGELAENIEEGRERIRKLLEEEDSK